LGGDATPPITTPTNTPRSGDTNGIARGQTIDDELVEVLAHRLEFRVLDVEVDGDPMALVRVTPGRTAAWISHSSADQSGSHLSLTLRVHAFSRSRASAAPDSRAPVELGFVDHPSSCRHGMARSIWSGTISFGLIDNFPHQK
jgi:hypothetical protein